MIISKQKRINVLYDIINNKQQEINNDKLTEEGVIKWQKEITEIKLLIDTLEEGRSSAEYQI